MLARSGALAGVMRVRGALPFPTLTIVTYHHIAEQDGHYHFDPDVADATPAQFRRQMETLAKHCNVVDMDRAIGPDAIEGSAACAEPRLMVTFDDGYRSCHDTALPILKAVGVPATFFIATGYTAGRKLFWWERIALVLATTKVEAVTLSYPSAIAVRPRAPGMRRTLTDLVKDTAALDVDRFLARLTAALEIPWSDDIERGYADDLIMTWDHIRAMAAAGMSIESHTRNHRVLQTLDDAALADEPRARARISPNSSARRRAWWRIRSGGRSPNDPRIRRAVDAAGYRLGMSNQSGVSRIWPRPVRGILPMDRLDIRRLATDRSMSDALYFGQVALPQLAYAARDGR